ncbi:Uma2 family endonuclease [Euhalothece natronophila Z-M001]|uniref:Uma2 family endonuclease n=1 Tax=Euhalothece natronophila Z-M001 TaxID=522448 RepID=A0A5B8NII9_9CHRO|nr:Uma2 family endonuclease [Euhalothece natronophila]QDZ38767.1 Uma2 family endonuclease [Euhalothece natronophila Z-M001]
MITTPQLKTETWLNGSWEDYLKTLETLPDEKGKGYYYDHQYRIEMSPLGNNHASDHSLLNYIIHLYATLMGIELNGKDNCTFRKAQFREAQPDLAFYIGDNANIIPWGTTIINLDQYPAPNLVIEIANFSLADDLGKKRLLYEDLGVEEYWVVDVKEAEITAFNIQKQGSYRLNISQVLPNLELDLLRKALQKSRDTSHSQVGAWLLQQFQLS